MGVELAGKECLVCAEELCGCGWLWWMKVVLLERQLPRLPLLLSMAFESPPACCLVLAVWLELFVILLAQLGEAWLCFFCKLERMTAVGPGMRAPNLD